VLYPNSAMLTGEPVDDAVDEVPAAGDELAPPLADELDELDELHAAASSAPASTTADDLRVFDTAAPYLSVNGFPIGTGRCKAGIAQWYSNAVMAPAPLQWAPALIAIRERLPAPE
jgi:hypothetical protein